MLDEIDNLFKRRIRIMVAIPHMGKTATGLETRVSKWILERDYDVQQVFKQDVPVSSCRNYIVKDFLKSDCDFLLTIDSDTLPTGNPLDLVKYNKDIVGAATPIWKVNYYAWAVGRQDKDGSYKQYPAEKRMGLQRVDMVGASCLMIRRKVLEAISKPFEDRFDENGIRSLGEDFNFCEKVRKAGFEIWCDWNLVCEHIKELSILPIIEALLRTYEQGVKKEKTNG